MCQEPGPWPCSTSHAPSLWWAFGTHEHYQVSLSVPEGHAAAPGGRLDAATGKHCASGARPLGLFVGKGCESLEVEDLEFTARSKLQEVVVELSQAVAPPEPPGAAERELRSRIRDLPWTDAGAAPLASFDRRSR